MSLLDVARDALKDLPVSDIVRERLALALDQSAACETKVTELERKIGELQAALQRERHDHQQHKEQLEKLQREHEEEVRVELGIEFRRGRRTGGKWQAFCAACHIPADLSLGDPQCPRSQCGWHVRQSSTLVRKLIEGFA